ncbi:hypothetical protein, partial [Serratia marcescens]|uniref:hypothetical protein n=1 Tax=Serratia marcescens TaxID=615 RepID=UPI0013DA19EF
NETKRDFPVEIYIAMVDALYADVRTFLFGALTAWVAALYAAYLTPVLILDGFAIALGLVSLARTLHIMSYRRARADVVTYEAARRWERAYTI